MSTAYFRTSNPRSFHPRLCIMAMVLSLLGIALPEGAVCADSLLAALGDSRQCDFSLQLQKSPYRENFIARIATIVTTYWASNDDPTIASDASDASDFSLSRFGTNNTAEHRETDIDSFSKECLNCHDGLRATDVTVDYRNEPGISGRGRHVSGKDHPIGMYYASYAALGRGYKPAAMLNRKMVLVNGKVGCLTCHNPLNPERSHLVMSDYRSALCLSCHDK